MTTGRADGENCPVMARKKAIAPFLFFMAVKKATFRRRVPMRAVLSHDVSFRGGGNAQRDTPVGFLMK